MNIPDGEYDIDLLVLDGSRAEPMPSLAIRYGFIPDSMDQTSPLTLYQQDEVCILEARLVERTSQSELLPIIFEGVPQRQRPAQGGASFAPDSYFLSFLPAEKSPRNLVSVQLRRLESTVRVNKSRNADKWRKSIGQWQNSPLLVPSLVPKQRSLQVLPPLLKRRPGKAPAKTGAASAAVASQPSPMKRASAAKRPPAAALEAKQDIISVSDFENLESEEEAEEEEEDPFPVFEPTAPGNRSNTATAAVEFTEVETMPESGRLPETSGDHPGRSNVETGGNGPGRDWSPPAKDNVIDMSDDFADLEDQLDEVLVENHRKPKFVNSDSDDDSDAEAFVGTPIVIDVGEDKTPTVPLELHRAGQQKKPMSLRDLYGADKTDYLSSSEEE